MSPRRPRRPSNPAPNAAAPTDASSEAPADADLAADADVVAVSISQDADRLEVFSAAATPEQPRCVVVASRAYRRRLSRRLREAQIDAAAVDRDELAALRPVRGLVVLVEASAADAPPAPVGAEGVVGVALLEETEAEAHAAALQLGWDAVVDRHAPVDVIVEVVWEAARGRTLLRSDVAHLLAARSVGPASSAAGAGDDEDAGGAAVGGAAAGAGGPGGTRPVGEPHRYVHAQDSRPEHVAHAEIEMTARDLAAAGNPLGEPRTALAQVPGTDAWQQMFDDAWVLWRPSTGVCVLCRGGAIATRYAELGGPSGYLGLPVSDETAVGAGAFCRFALSGGAIVWHPRHGVHETQGALGEYWLDVLGGPSGPWGFPISDEYNSGDGLRAVDFEGGTLMQREDRGIAELARQQEFGMDRWLTLLPEPPRRPGGTGKAAVVGIREPGPDEEGGCRLYYTAATAGLLARTHDPAVVAVSAQIERSRALVPPTEGGTDQTPGLLRTAVEPPEVLERNGTTLPPGLTAADLHRAELDVWRDIWEVAPELPTQPQPAQTKLAWAGFPADGHLEYLLSTLFTRSPDARSVFLQCGIGVEEIHGRLALVVADTEQGWRLLDDDAERYVRCDLRLLSLFGAVLSGAVPPQLLGGNAETVDQRNAALRQAALDAQFLTVVAHAGRLPGWSLVPPWTRELRAAVAHNIHLGCLTGWDPYAGTGGDPVEVVRAMVKDFFCGPSSLLAQSLLRFQGPPGHGVLRDAAMSFPPAVAHDDPHARYIIAGTARRRVDLH